MGPYTLEITFQDKQEGHRQKMREQVQTPEAVPRLYDLVKTQDDRLKLAFFAVLGNTVVAKDLDQVKILQICIYKECNL